MPNPLLILYETRTLWLGTRQKEALGRGRSDIDERFVDYSERVDKGFFPVTMETGGQNHGVH
jgi:hypothetical protein